MDSLIDEITKELGKESTKDQIKTTVNQLLFCIIKPFKYALISLFTLLTLIVLLQIICIFLCVRHEKIVI